MTSKSTPLNSATTATTVNLEELALVLTMLATDWVEDERGNPVDVSDILALFDGAVGFDVVDYWTSAKVSEGYERTLAGWVPSGDLQNSHNIEAFCASFESGATDWSGRNSDGHPVDLDGAYDPDNSGFFDKFGTSDVLGVREIVEPEEPQSGWFDPDHIETLWDLEEVPTI